MFEKHWTSKRCSLSLYENQDCIYARLKNAIRSHFCVSLKHTSCIVLFVHYTTA
nr:MAG TPA_asm: hypothetical protein [Caudoviricetes sp.]